VKARDEHHSMIKLTRMDGQEIAINCDQIAWLEACPDTTVRMLAGETILVRESLDEVIARSASYRVGLLREAGLPGLLGAGAVGIPPSALPASEHASESRSGWETAT
jgi:uncharacterized protein YlzI (FlbEa/FlbD family)